MKRVKKRAKYLARPALGAALAMGAGAAAGYSGAARFPNLRMVKNVLARWKPAERLASGSLKSINP